MTPKYMEYIFILFANKGGYLPLVVLSGGGGGEGGGPCPHGGNPEYIDYVEIFFFVFFLHILCRFLFKVPTQKWQVLI